MQIEWWTKPYNSWIHGKNLLLQRRWSGGSDQDQGSVDDIKQEQRLLSRLLVITNSRPEFELKDAIGKFELNVTPPSNIHPDGSMIMLSSKSNVVPLVMDMAVQDEAVDMPPERQGVTKVVMIVW